MAEPTISAATAAMAVASGVGAAVGAGFIDQASIAVLGVKAIVVLFAVLGAAAALAYSEPISPRARLFFMVLVNSLFGIVASVVIGHIPLFEWTNTIPGQGIAFVVAFLALWAMPAVIRWIPSFIEGRLKKPSSQDTQPGDRNV